MKVYLDPFPHIRIEHGKPLQGWYKAKVEGPGVRNRPCFTEAILTQPYGGYCAVGCAFCYINSGSQGYRGSGLISVPQGYGEQVRKTLKKMRTSAAGYFSSFTDPFLPLESIYHNTQEGAQAFVDEGLPVFFLSRLAYPGWAYDLLKKNHYSYAQKSINTPVQEDWKKLSPGAITLAEHMEEIREMRKRGIYVSIQVNPIVAGIVTHDQVEQTFEMLAEAGANHVIVKFVEAAYSWAPSMIKRMEKRFGKERTDKFAALFTENIGGQRTIVEPYRLEGHIRYQRKATSLGLTYATCYEYMMERDASGKIVNKTGKSIGRDFLTADQCHGHRVPMFTRGAAGPFEEVAECPPTGCLSCSDENAGKPRCGSETMGSALALREKDLKVGVYDKTAQKLRVLS
jgi:DNA repair photolyase